MTTDDGNYAIQHPDGRWLYYLPARSNLVTAPRTGVYADGTPMTQLDSGWWATDHQAECITVRYQPGPKVTGYVLTDADAASVRYPTRLTAEEWQERRASVPEGERETLWALYESVTEPQEPYEETVRGPFVVLEGAEPPATDAPQWKAQLPYTLTERPEYRHLFPGYIPNFRKHLCDVIKAMPRVEVCFDGYGGKVVLHVGLQVPFDPPKVEWRARTGSRGQALKSGRNVPVYARRTLDLPVPDRIAGPNYAAALDEWNDQVTYWTAVVTDASVAACGACSGTGHTPVGSEEYEATR